MTEWSFDVVLNREPTDAEADALFEAGLDDCGVVLGGRGQPSYLSCHREAPDLVAAVLAVAAEVRTVPGLRAVRARHDDLVTLGAAAQRTNGLRTRESLRLLAGAKRGPGGFPAPVNEDGGARLYSWTEVATWLREVLGDALPEVVPDLVVADHALRLADDLARYRSVRPETVRRYVFPEPGDVAA
ncbi:hypothetical protein JJV70_06190 [Streptomyces sp. JJ66]|uniref:hypothetical protein n=1 Tax=Streptomyces sp. JJ66 TaxID=2803843 RepID=UPI001C5A1BA9|nr:hypothetical protein [Streptomyces sp. JJ66]MBW1601708.1 hypothetical protein [Streptomyces sp. JJ66]